MFAIIVVGAIGVLGATSAGGLTGSLSTGFISGRVAKDVTAATTYLQALQEYIAAKGSGGVTPGTYCAGTCTGGETALPADYPTPSSQELQQPYQLAWTTLVVVIDTWGWNGATGQYAPDPGCASDCLVRVESTLTWQVQGVLRTVRLQRFLP